MTHVRRSFISLALFTALPISLTAQVAQQDTVETGQFDYGKMWTFEYAPSQYFTDTYGFDANAAWFEQARLSAVRIPGCSASFVSPNGLLVTNHHCVRGRVAQVSQPGETLLDSGFYAATLEEERPIPGYYADQLIAIEDVSDEVFAAIDRVDDPAEKERVRQAVLTEIQTELSSTYMVEGANIRVQIISLYHGGRYSAYVFRRFTDVRLVFAVELQIGSFGGDPDNFTYPRYALDFAFLRVYDNDGNPHQADHFFGWGNEGVEEGDVVFVIGNPGPTSRLNTMAQLEFQRDVTVPARVAFLETRLTALWDFYNDYPEEGEQLNIRPRAFSLSNSFKANSGRLEALSDLGIMARKAGAERDLRVAIQTRADLSAQYGNLLDEIAAIQQEKRRHAAEYAAFQSLGNSSSGSATIRRALMAYRMIAEPNPALGDTLASLAGHPAELEQALLTARFADFEQYLGADHEITRAALQGMDPAAAATAMIGRSVLGDQSRTQQAIAAGSLRPSDPAVSLVSAIEPHYNAYLRDYRALVARERQLASDLGRVRFEVYGSEIPPDATSSPRITDGVVRSYEYNGTLAPPYTTFFGIYDRYFSHERQFDWALPGKWRTPPAGLDLRTPLNFVSTADTYGGNSGSPAVTPALEIVGLNFDRNIEGLSRDFIYLPERGRNIMVDVRAIRAALDQVYSTDRILAEIETGRLFTTESEAEGARR
ncbi:MAG: S46 family peptidase [Gemmatimonadota bacterium]|nr:MAG: S46 family peptidase [Gemmatimonadota bacterium]